MRTIDMTENLILSEIYKLPENLKLEALHFIVFLNKEYAQPKFTKKQNKRVFGRVKGKYKLEPDFDAPLDDFKDYI
jgi:hypothetical protein